MGSDVQSSKLKPVANNGLKRKCLLLQTKWPLESLELSLLEQGSRARGLPHSPYSCGLTKLLRPTSLCGQAAFCGPWFSLKLVGVATNTSFCGFFQGCLQTDDGNSVFPKGQNFLPPVVMMSVSMAKIGVTGSPQPLLQKTVLSLGFWTI